MAFNDYTEADLLRWREVPMNKEMVTWLEGARSDLQAEALGYAERGTYNEAHQAIGGARALEAVLLSLRRRDPEAPVADPDDDFNDPAMPDGEIRKARNAKASIGEA